MGRSTGLIAKVGRHLRDGGSLVSRRMLPAVLGIAMTACQTVGPVQHSGEEPAAPTRSGSWNALGARIDHDAFRLLNTGSEALEWRLRAIDSAEDSVDLQTFLWKDDPSGARVLAQLIAAADRGVRVRILLDDSFTVGEADAILAVARHPEIDVRIYNPFGYRPDSMALRQLLNLGEFGRIDHRMHNKSMLVDGTVGIVGGRNIADEYFGAHGESNFRDMEVLAFGPVTGDIGAAFARYWNSPWSIDAGIVLAKRSAAPDEAGLRAWLADHAAARPAPESEEERARRWRQALAEVIPGRATLLADEPAQRDPASEVPNQVASEILRWIGEARHELILVSAYLVPTPALEQAIERAEQRGVEARILTNSLRSNNHTAAHSAYRGFVERLLGHGADLHEVKALAKDRSVYMDDPVLEKHLGLHAKLLLIDDSLTFIGSANLDPRSLEINTEMGLLIESGDFNRHVREQLAVDFDLRNAWHLRRTADGRLTWVSDDEILDQQPAESAFQRLEDWFLSLLPIAAEM